MKVCTDACILGAWFAPKIADTATVLDIGTGTGLLMMMLAQQSEAEIHGIEINKDAFKQVEENIAGQKWKNRFKIFHGDARKFHLPMKYDFIISNPPFYEKDLRSGNDAIDTAMHSSQLQFDELFQIIQINLLPNGTFGILLPVKRAEEFIKLAAVQNFHLVEKLMIRQSCTRAYFRTVLHFARVQQNPKPDTELVIQSDEGVYTEEFVELMREYYLNL